MKRAFWIVFALVLGIFIYFGAKATIVISNNLQIYQKENARSGTFGYKETREKEDLLSMYLKAADNLILNIPADEPKNNTLNFYELIDYFPTFINYYSAKLKIKEGIFNQLTSLHSSTLKLSESELKTYFSKNSDYLGEYFGLTKYEYFSEFIKQIRQYSDFNISEIKVIKDNLYYDYHKNVTVFRIIATSNSDNMCFELNAFHDASIKNQQAPVISFRPIGGTY